MVEFKGAANSRLAVVYDPEKMDVINVILSHFDRDMGRRDCIGHFDKATLLEIAENLRWIATR